MNNSSSSMNFLVLLATLLLLGVAGQGQQSPLVSQMRVPQQTNRALTKHAKVVSHEPRAFARVAASSPNAEVQLESMIQVAQAENQANLVGPFSRYGADLMQFAPHQQTGMLPGVFGNPTNAFQVPNAFDAQSAFHSANFQPGGFQNGVSFLPSAFQGSGTLRAALQASATQLAPITVTHGTTQEEPQSQSLPATNFGGFSATPQFGSTAYPQDRQSNSGFQISQNLPGTHFPVTILPTGNFGQSPILPSFQAVNAAAQPGQHWPNFFGQNQGNVAPYRFEKTRTPLVNTFQTIPAPQVGAKTFYPALPVPEENEPKRAEQSEEHENDEESDDDEGDDDDENQTSESHEDDDEEEEESKTQAFQANINKNWCDVNPLCKKQQKSPTESVEQVTGIPVSDYWDHVRMPYQFPSADAGAFGSERREHKTTQKKKNTMTSEKELVPGYHHYNYELPEEFLKEYDDASEEVLETTNTKKPTTNKKTTNKYQ